MVRVIRPASGAVSVRDWGDPKVIFTERWSRNGSRATETAAGPFGATSETGTACGRTNKTTSAPRAAPISSTSPAIDHERRRGAPGLATTRVRVTEEHPTIVQVPRRLLLAAISLLELAYRQVLRCKPVSLKAAKHQDIKVLAIRISEQRTVQRFDQVKTPAMATVRYVVIQVRLADRDTRLILKQTSTYGIHRPCVVPGSSHAVHVSLRSFLVLVPCDRTIRQHVALEVGGRRPLSLCDLIGPRTNRCIDRGTAATHQDHRQHDYKPFHGNHRP